MAVRYAAVHTGHPGHSWRKVDHHTSLERATKGDDGAENLLRGNMKVGRTMRERWGPAYAAFVWDDTATEGIGLRLAAPGSQQLVSTTVLVSVLESFKRSRGPSLDVIDEWFQRAPALGPWHPDDLPDGVSYLEGAARQVVVNAYERNQAAREACIAHHGAVCKVCQMDFASRYGPLGAGFIHVHHDVPLAAIGVEYLVDPVADLKPVCPNCHAMLHRQEPPLLIATLRAMLQPPQATCLP